MQALPDDVQVSSTPIRLLMANLPAIVSDLLHKVLENIPDIQVVKPPIEIPFVAKTLNSEPVDVLLLGISRDQGPASAIEAISSLRPRNHRTRFLILCEKPDYAHTIALFRAGASGIISGDDLRVELLCKSVRCVHSGDIWANNQTLKHLVASLTIQHSNKVSDARGEPLLTNRQEEVLQLVAGGLSNAELARALNLSEHTIKNHLFKIYEKLGVSNRMEAALYFAAPRTPQPAVPRMLLVKPQVLRPAPKTKS